MVEIMKIRNHLYLLSGGIYGELGNVWMIDSSEGCILFDCGSVSSYDTIISNLSYWGFNANDVTHVFLTHGHDDHAGCASQFQKLGASIHVGKGDAFMLENGNLGNYSPFISHIMPKCQPDDLIEKDINLTIGNLYINAYTMPGHTNGTIVYDVIIEDEKILFTGDMFVCDGEKGEQALIWWKGDINYSAEKLGESFKRLWEMNLQPTIIASGHGNPRISEDAKKLIMTAYRNYLLNCR